LPLLPISLYLPSACIDVQTLTVFLPVEEFTLIAIAIGVNAGSFAVELTLAQFAFAAIAIRKNVNSFPAHFTLDKSACILISIGELTDTFATKFSIVKQPLITSPFFKSKQPLTLSVALDKLSFIAVAVRIFP